MEGEGGRRGREGGGGGRKGGREGGRRGGREGGGRRERKGKQEKAHILTAITQSMPLTPSHPNLPITKRASNLI